MKKISTYLIKKINIKFIIVKLIISFENLILSYYF